MRVVPFPKPVLASRLLADYPDLTRLAKDCGGVLLPVSPTILDACLRMASVIDMDTEATPRDKEVVHKWIDELDLDNQRRRYPIRGDDSAPRAGESPPARERTGSYTPSDRDESEAQFSSISTGQLDDLKRDMAHSLKRELAHLRGEMRRDFDAFLVHQRDSSRRIVEEDEEVEDDPNDIIPANLRKAHRSLTPVPLRDSPQPSSPWRSQFQERRPSNLELPSEHSERVPRPRTVSPRTLPSTPPHVYSAPPETLRSPFSPRPRSFAAPASSAQQEYEAQDYFSHRPQSYAPPSPPPQLYSSPLPHQQQHAPQIPQQQQQYLPPQPQHRASVSQDYYGRPSYSSPLPPQQQYYGNYSSPAPPPVQQTEYLPSPVSPPRSSPAPEPGPSIQGPPAVPPPPRLPANYGRHSVSGPSGGTPMPTSSFPTSSFPPRPTPTPASSYPTSSFPTSSFPSTPAARPTPASSPYPTSSFSHLYQAGSTSPYPASPPQAHPAGASGSNPAASPGSYASGSSTSYPRSSFSHSPAPASAPAPSPSPSYVPASSFPQAPLSTSPTSYLSPSSYPQQSATRASASYMPTSSFPQKRGSTSYAPPSPQPGSSNPSLSYPRAPSGYAPTPSIDPAGYAPAKSPSGYAPPAATATSPTHYRHSNTPGGYAPPPKGPSASSYVPSRSPAGFVSTLPLSYGPVSPQGTPQPQATPHHHYQPQQSRLQPRQATPRQPGVPPVPPKQYAPVSSGRHHARLSASDRSGQSTGGAASPLPGNLPWPKEFAQFFAQREAQEAVVTKTLGVKPPLR